MNLSSVSGVAVLLLCVNIARAESIPFSTRKNTTLFAEGEIGASVLEDLLDLGDEEILPFGVADMGPVIYDFLLSDGVSTWMNLAVNCAIIGDLLIVAVLFELIRMRLHKASNFTKKRALLLGLTGVVMFALVSQLFLQGNQFLLHRNRDVYEYLVNLDYTITEGVVHSVETAPKLWASDPVPTFKVAETVFEYGVSTDNFNLDVRAFLRRAAG